ncbi:SDR family NAD(P)-dependent oxidoreductase [Microbulbifer spongiae]|uniref:SDR family NAD(P)-dependent oxidoreductase n=1 Tax=Microbulbifer spongiae TaxID=2944933 RepID=A0ABY9ECG1_9GAMM|nr:SDR family NAD(P)-dependent oxidoreductase [Microbulbifer sp. MI-G]WKD49189.1 SDR family NAD(P)-dependent oxidoreductase [Microbulbifer sp. MI-G]
MQKKEALKPFTESYLKSLIADVSNKAALTLDADVPFGELGIDSFHVLKIIKRLEEEFGDLPKTLLFENFNISDLARYFIERHPSTVSRLLSASDTVSMQGGKTTAAVNDQRHTTGTGLDINRVTNSSCTVPLGLPAEPILMSFKQALEQSAIAELLSPIYAAYKNEASVSRGMRNIAPNLFLGRERKGFINYSRSNSIILAYAYTGPEYYFETIVEEFYSHCINLDLQLNVICDVPLQQVGHIAFSATPFGVVQRIRNIRNFSLEGGKMRRLRYLVQKFEKQAGAQLIEYQCGNDSAVDEEIVAVIDDWCSERVMINPLVYIAREQIISGTFSPEHRIFLTRTDNLLQNVIIITAMEGEDKGYLMDLEFYPKDMPFGGLEFAIVEIIKILAAEGSNLLSLGATFGPKLNDSANANANADVEIDHLLDELREQNLFNDEGNLQFKNKFRPKNSSIYLCREQGAGRADNIIDIVMMIADPEKLQTPDDENFNYPIQQISQTNSIITSQQTESAYYPLTTGDEQIFGENGILLQEHGYNPLNIAADQVFVDLKTDSWAQLTGDTISNRIAKLHQASGLQFSLPKVIRTIFPFSYFAIADSGRAAEDAFYRAWAECGKEGKVIPQNILFPTCLFHQIDKGFTPLEMPVPELFNQHGNLYQRGNIDLTALQEYLQTNAGEVAFACVEISNNAAGGSPITCGHLAKLKALLDKFDIALIMDATRILDNALLICDKPQNNKAVLAQVNELLMFADVVVASLAKDFAINKGGIIASNDADLINQVEAVIQNQALGLDVIDRKALVNAMQTQNYWMNAARNRIQQVAQLADEFVAHQLPIVTPVGGHCVLLDVKQLEPFADFAEPAASFCAWLFNQTGIRVSVHNIGMQTATSINELVRLAVPLGMTSQQVNDTTERFLQALHQPINIAELVRTHEFQSEVELMSRYRVKDWYNVEQSTVNNDPQPSTAVTNSAIATTIPLTSATQPAKNLSSAKATNKEIAIIGMAGRYPKADNLQELWDNLITGRDCVEVIPEDRYYGRPHFANTIRYRGGFINNIDKFDSLFFNISPREAKVLDPQERLFLEVSWETLEDAGYYPENIVKQDQPRDIGVFVGAVWTMYQLLGSEQKISGREISSNSFLWSIANRVSYWMNFSGPSLTIDTACSSSLTAMYQACEAINQGDCSAALVGGVNLDLHQHKFDINWNGRALSPDGVCRSFGEGANGYVAGEGIGAVLLKPLAQAQQDRDQIYAVIKAVAVNHGGKTSGYTVPSPKAQSDLIKQALHKAKITPEQVDYIEAHGTGTELGDPIEISALNMAFGSTNVISSSIPIGSIKSNIGHLEAAAGIVSVHKVALQMQRKQLVPSLHSQAPNPLIDFDNSPFYIQQTHSEWTPAAGKLNDSKALIAGISSFGAGGANTHLILQQYKPHSVAAVNGQSRINHTIVPLSARNEKQLMAIADRLHRYLLKQTDNDSLPDYSDLVFTLQCGRKSFEHRVAILSDNFVDLTKLLELVVSGATDEKILRGNSKNSLQLTEYMTQSEKTELLNILLQQPQPEKLARMWVDGILNDWQGFTELTTAKRIALPTYPFANKRHWIDSELQLQSVNLTAALHPLIDVNASTFERQLFRKTFTEQDFCIHDHLVSDIPTLPGVAYLELVRKAAELSASRQVQKLRNVVWVSPLTVEKAGGTEAFVELMPQEGSVSFEVFSEQEGRKLLYCQGKLEYRPENPPVDEFIDLAAIEARCKKVIDAADIYPLFNSLGLSLGPSFQALQQVRHHEKEILGVLNLPEIKGGELEKFWLHPSIIDSSLQAGMGANVSDGGGEMYIPYSIGQVEIFHPLSPNCFSYVENITKKNARVSKANIRIVDATGRVLVKINESTGVPLLDVHAKRVSSTTDVQRLLYTPYWQQADEQPSDVQQQQVGQLLFLSKIQDNFASYQEKLNQQGISLDKVVLASLGNHFSKVDTHHYCINPSEQENYQQLLTTLQQQGRTPDVIYFDWHSTEFDSQPVELDRQLQSSIYSLLTLLKALSKAKWTGKILCPYQFSGLPNPVIEAINGFAITAQLENRKIKIKTLGWDTALTMTQKLALLQYEGFVASQKDGVIRYIDGQRFKRQMAVVAPEVMQPREIAIKQGGVYLITGGVGGLGLMFAKHLARRYQVKLMLTGRSRSSAVIDQKLQALRDAGAEVSYFAADVSKITDVSKLTQATRDTFGTINGVIHSAGVLRDSLLQHKTTEELDAVLAPKIQGTLHLDESCQQDQLDFFVVFSSLAAVGGNAGQSDYAYANHFMDSYMHRRHVLQQRGLRYGHSLSFNWSIWRNGGMQLDDQTEQFFRNVLGITPLQNDVGLEAFELGLTSKLNQLVVLQGIPDKIENAWGIRKPHAIATDSSINQTAAVNADESKLADQVSQRLVRVVMDFLELAEEDIDLDEILLDLGFDSIGLTTFANKINQIYKLDVSPVLFFEYPSIRELSGHLAKTYPEQVGREKNDSIADPHPKTVQPLQATGHPVTFSKQASAKYLGSAIAIPEQAAQINPANRFVDMPIAIVGVAGTMPQSEDVEEFWQNLRDAKNMITEIPKERWSWQEFLGDPMTEMNKSNSIWGGFMKEVDKFDAFFFGISPREAEMMDPQQRIFLQTVWHAIEDSGHKIADLSGSKTGLFVGVATNDYTDVIRDMKLPLDAYTSTGNSHSVLVNRISFLLNLRGPSAPIDTACSSSLIALHRAIESIHTGSSEMAIVGGVQVMLSPSAYICFGQAGMLSTDGKCKTFDKRADGYVRGEGSGAVVLKPLYLAERDKNPVYAVVRATAENHGGKVTTLTAPNPQAQVNLLIEAYKKADIDPTSVGYIECHGTGTSLGDPIEIKGLKGAFRELFHHHQNLYATEKLIGLSSVKTNIGHLETAAGISGIIKVLMAIKHQQIPASLHFEKLNPYIDLDSTPFYVVDKTQTWKRRKDTSNQELPLCAGISSFGFGGANAHAVLQEYRSTWQSDVTLSAHPILISAKDPKRLQEYASNLLQFIERHQPKLTEFAYTLAVGRDLMDFRAGFVSSSIQDVCDKLRQIATITESTDSIYTYQLNKDKKADKAWSQQFSQITVTANSVESELISVVNSWVHGASVDWQQLYSEQLPARISLPGYPFARQRVWLQQMTGDDNVMPQFITTDGSQPQLSLLCYQHTWQTTTVAEQWHNPGRVLALVNSKAGKQLVAELLEPLVDQDIIWLWPGQKYALQRSKEFTLEVNCEDHYQQLFERLADADQLPDTIIYHWSYTTDFGVEDDLTPQLTLAPIATMLLLKAMTAQTRRSLGFSYLTVSQSHNLTPVDGAVSALFKSLVKEGLPLRFKHIAVRNALGKHSLSQADMRQLRAALTSIDVEMKQLVIDNGQLLSWEAGYVPLAAPALKPFKQQGVYVITGGTGGLGLIFATHLAQYVKARLVLTGRSKQDNRITRLVDKLQSEGAQVRYVSADIANINDVIRLRKTTLSEFGSVDGIIHSAGLTRDALLNNKSLIDIEAVLAAKTHGAVNVVQQFAEQTPDFVVLFSSITATTGNAGQSDYAYANAFMDKLAHHLAEHNGLGKLLAINWPLWQDGGMQVSDDIVTMLQSAAGLHPLTTEQGIAAFEAALSAHHPQITVAFGEAGKITPIFISAASSHTASGSKVEDDAANPLTKQDMQSLVSQWFEDDFMSLVENVLRVDREHFARDINMGDYGFDSISLTRLFKIIADTYAFNLTPSTFYEYPTFNELTAHISEQYATELSAHYQSRIDELNIRQKSRAGPESVAASTAVPTLRDKVAIVGISGRFPGAANADEFWDNLIHGRSVVSELSSQRHQLAQQIDNTISASATIRGGFINEIDQFDPSFFAISETDAALMEPSHRLLIESVWHTFEDAGYRSSAFAGRKVGVFVGGSSGEYQRVLAKHKPAATHLHPLNTEHSLLANRISYMYDLTGPSETINTTCSSALLAIHRAVDSILQGECQAAVVAGVNIMINPMPPDFVSGSMLFSASGQCRAFDKNADGSVPAEAVASVLLKPLSQAEADGDNIYGIIRGSGVNHKGQSGGLFASSPHAQADLISRVYAKAGVSPDAISYIETNGTGWPLADVIEVDGLKRSFTMMAAQQRQQLAANYCYLGAIKSNTGHAGAAAGMLGLIKVLMAMRHQWLPANLNLEQINPDLQLADSPFRLLTEPVAWPSNHSQPRLAGVSAFGVGGTNAHILLEEYTAQYEGITASHLHQLIFPLSAKSKKQLLQTADNLFTWLQSQQLDNVSLQQIAATLQMGREAFDHRLAIVAQNHAQLCDGLEAYLTGNLDSSSLFYANIAEDADSIRLLQEDPKVAASLITSWVNNDKPEKLMEFWCRGLNIDWQQIYEDKLPLKQSLPGYPFARNRYWADMAEIFTPADTSNDPLQNETKFEFYQFYRNFPAGENIQSLTRLDAVTRMIIFISQYIAKTLTASPENISHHQHFIALGMTSLEISSLALELSELLTIKLSVGDLFNYSTVLSLAKQLADKYPKKIMSLQLVKTRASLSSLTAMEHNLEVNDLIDEIRQTDKSEFSDVDQFTF